MNAKDDSLEMLINVEKVAIGFFPTPLHRLDKISAELGYDIWCKRDDLTGNNAFGGNKIRKLEYLMGEAIATGCDTVITYGATQSNHVMETISAARLCGLTPIVYLICLVEPDENDVRANLLLDTIYGAEIHLVPANGEPLSVANKRSNDLAARRIAELEKEGHKCYNIPLGGASGVGSSAYISGYQEILRQMESHGKKMRYLFTSTGTGGTLAGLAAGRALFKDTAEIIGIQVSPKTTEYGQHITSIANDALDYIGKTSVRVTTDDFTYDGRFFGEGYEIPSSEANDAIRYLARMEGILTDPVYTGKGMLGMLSYLREGKLPAGSTVVFLHTGGTTALFSEKKIVGDLISV